jgi:type IV pilus assembly protein PilB
MDRNLVRTALLHQNVLSVAELDRLADESLTHGLELDQWLVRQGVLSPEDLNQRVARELKIPYIDLKHHIFEGDVIRLVPAELARKHKAIPAYRIGDSLTIIMAHPDDILGLDELRRVTGLAVAPALGNENEIEQAIAEQYGIATQGDATETIREYAADQIEIDLPQQLKTENAEDMAGEAPVVRYVNEIISQAIRERASDIHVEPDENELRVRFRTDGALRIASRVPMGLAPAIISRIKILARMDIAENRRPQDGQFQTTTGSRSIDVRVASFPTIRGENVVLRLLDKSDVLLGMDELGLSPPVLARFRELLQQPYGILLVTGPTGSGKTTTLYAGLQSLNSEDKNIITIEDPVEYQLPLIRQCQVNPKAGITFATGLRAILRQDPDIVLVGEIRDTETAEIAIQAALTGHLVLTTLHTNDAASAIARLVDMGIEPFLVASSLLGVIGQRLVRRICARCQMSYRPEPEVVRVLGLPENSILSRGKGCAHCRGTGYRGRIGIFELLTVDDTIRRLAMQRSSAPEILNHATSVGMITLRQHGIEKILQGATTPEEVIRTSRSR